MGYNKFYELTSLLMKTQEDKNSEKILACWENVKYLVFGTFFEISLPPKLSFLQGWADSSFDLSSIQLRAGLHEFSGLPKKPKLDQVSPTLAFPCT